MTAPTPSTGTPIPDALGEPYVYKRAGGRALRVFVLQPGGAGLAENRAAMVWFHGGSWIKGGPGALNDQAEFLTSLGMVNFLVEYRLVDRGASPAVCIRDAKSAMRWIRQNARFWAVDTDRIAAGGGSAGAHLAASTALLEGFDEEDDVHVSPRPAALVLFNPVLDNGPDGFGHARMEGRFREYSPAHNVSPGAPPTLILSGEADHLAGPQMLRDFQDRMKNAGARCDLKIYEGGRHGFYRKSETDAKYFLPTLQEMQTFLHSLGWIS